MEAPLLSHRHRRRLAIAKKKGLRSACLNRSPSLKPQSSPKSSPATTSPVSHALAIEISAPAAPSLSPRTKSISPPPISGSLELVSPAAIVDSLSDLEAFPVLSRSSKKNRQPIDNDNPEHVQLNVATSPMVCTTTLSPVRTSPPTAGVSVNHENAWQKGNNDSSKVSWNECFTGSSKKMSRKGVPFQLESGEFCVKIPNEVIKRNQHSWQNFIIGQFHGNLPSMGALHAILNGIWSKKSNDISISKATEKSVLIKIPCPITRRRVLGQGMWHIEGQAMFVADWEPGLSLEMPELEEAPVWLDFQGVPMHFFSQEGLEHIAGSVGEPLFLHPNTANKKNLEVARVYTIVNLKKSLPEAVNVMFESGEVHRIKVSSPWLPPTCSFYEKIGHSLRRCPTAPSTCVKCKSTTHSADNCQRLKKSIVSDKTPKIQMTKSVIDPTTIQTTTNSSIKQKTTVEQPITTQPVGINVDNTVRNPKNVANAPNFTSEEKGKGIQTVSDSSHQKKKKSIVASPSSSSPELDVDSEDDELPFEDDGYDRQFPEPVLAQLLKRTSKRLKERKTLAKG